MLLNQGCVWATKDKDLWNVNVPYNPIPKTCRLNWQKKFHLCSCDSKKKPCAHLIAALVTAKIAESVDQVLKMKRNKFKSAKFAKRALGSRKEPKKDYYINPSIPEPHTPADANDYTEDMIQEKIENSSPDFIETSPCVSPRFSFEKRKLSQVEEILNFTDFCVSPKKAKMETQREDIFLPCNEDESIQWITSTPISSPNRESIILSIPPVQVTSIAQQLLTEDKRTESKRTPARLLKLLKYMDVDKVMVVNDTKHYGDLAICSLGQHDTIVKTTEIHHDDLITYAAKLSRTADLKIDGKVRVRIVREELITETQNQTGMKWTKDNIVYDEYLSFAVCCLEPVLPDQEILAESCTNCKNLIHLDCVEQADMFKVSCKACQPTSRGIQWGAGKKNTCPLDAPLQIILSHSLENKRLIECIQNTDYEKKCMGPLFAKTFRNAKNEFWARLHINWANAIGIKGDSMYGATNQVFWEQCKEGGFIICNVTCDNCPYKGNTFDQISKFLKIYRYNFSWFQVKLKHTQSYFLIMMFQQGKTSKNSLKLAEVPTSHAKIAKLVSKRNLLIGPFQIKHGSFILMLIWHLIKQRNGLRCRKI